MSEKPLTPEELESLRRHIDSANVSEAAKEFYREHLCLGYHTIGGWRNDDYDLIKELDMANLVRTKLVYVVHDS